MDDVVGIELGDTVLGGELPGSRKEEDSLEGDAEGAADLTSAGSAGTSGILWEVLFL